MLDYKGDKIIIIKNIKYSTERSTMVCIDYVCSVCKGDDPDCPLGGSWTTCTSIHNDGLPIGGDWDPGYVETGEPFGDGGGGSPNPTLPPCPGTIWYELWRVAEAGSGSNSPNCSPVINPCGQGGVTLPDGTCVNSSDYPGKEEGMPYLWWTNIEWIKINFSFGQNSNIQGAPDEGITWEEARLIHDYPNQALAIRKNVNIAINETEIRFPNAIKVNDKADAFRHTFWIAINVKSVGYPLAKLFSDAHETEVEQKFNLEKTMDLHNNSVGLNDVYAGLQTMPSVETLAQLSYNAVINGLCWYLKPIYYNDPCFWGCPGNSTGTHGITSSTQIIPTNQ